MYDYIVFGALGFAKMLAMPAGIYPWATVQARLKRKGATVLGVKIRKRVMLVLLDIVPEED